MSCVYWYCDKCGASSVIDSICPNCGSIMGFTYDESRFGGPEPRYVDSPSANDDDSSDDGSDFE
jgi:hypothetical protein